MIILQDVADAHRADYLRVIGHLWLSEDRVVLDCWYWVFGKTDT